MNSNEPRSQAVRTTPTSRPQPQHKRLLLPLLAPLSLCAYLSRDFYGRLLFRPPTPTPCFVGAKFSRHTMLTIRTTFCRRHLLAPSSRARRVALPSRVAIAVRLPPSRAPACGTAGGLPTTLAKGAAGVVAGLEA
eukprot:1497044-Pleurochrysis_carterae.AAC.1